MEARALTLFFAVLMLCNTTSGALASANLSIATKTAVQSVRADKKQDIKVRTSHPTERVRLPQLAKETLAVHFGASKYKNVQELIDATPVSEEYKRPAGLFVTLSRKGKTRACWGSIEPTNQNLVSATIETTENALTKEYRFPRIRNDEWPFLKAQVTVVRGLEPISGLSGHNAMQYGMMVRQGGKGAVLLPGEVTDAHYQLIKCKLKAGIPINQPCQIYRIRADVLK